MPPMPSSAGGAPGHGPSNFDKLKMGGMMGGSVGMIMGFIYGTYHVMRFGGGINGPMRTLGQYMLGSATTFGFFMSIGSVIRTEGHSTLAEEAFARARRQPIIIPRRRVQWGANE
ncbi:MAG: subunit of TIM23 translocase complex [Stictis urceolatum]|nr:subunit of TIM23 translocase complex [Stictis urceolata]